MEIIKKLLTVFQAKKPSHPEIMIKSAGGRMVVNQGEVEKRFREKYRRLFL